MKKLLIVEDEKITVMMLRVIIAKMAVFQIFDVPSGEEAIELAQKEKPEFIIMDINLCGKMSGIEATSIISSIYNANIIYATGNSDEATLSQARDTNPKEILIKPINPQVLNKIIQSLL